MSLTIESQGFTPANLRKRVRRASLAEAQASVAPAVEIDDFSVAGAAVAQSTEVAMHGLHRQDAPSLQAVIGRYRAL